MKTIKDFRKSKRIGKIYCSYCKLKSNRFALYQRDTGHMEFECLNCGRSIISSFVKKKELERLRG